MAGPKRLRNIHPGEVLVTEFLEPLGISAYRLAKDLHVPLTRVSEIVHERRGISADSALRLARYFGTTAKFWLGLQEDFDLEEQGRSKKRELEEITAFQPS